MGWIKRIRLKRRRKPEYVPPPSGPRFMNRPGGAGMVDRTDPTGRQPRHGHYRGHNY
jgi:hypothetical protein